MKLINRIIFIVVITASWQCSPIKESESNYNESDHPSESETSLLSSFETNVLDSIALAAYDKRSLEKVEEFFEYSAIIGDTSIPAEIRKKAGEQLISLFNKKKGKINIGGSQISIKKYVHQIMEEEFKLDDIPADFKLTSTFSQNVSSPEFSNKVNFLYQNENGNAISILVKSKKVFGQEERNIWEIFLQEVSI